MGIGHTVCVVSCQEFAGFLEIPFLNFSVRFGMASNPFMNQFHGGNDDVNYENVWYCCVSPQNIHINELSSSHFSLFQAVENGGADTSAFISPDVANFPVKRENGKTTIKYFNFGKMAFPPKRRAFEFFGVIAQTADFETVVCAPLEASPSGQL